MQVGSDVGYWEIYDGFETSPRQAFCRDLVVLSNIAHGASESPGAPGLCVRLVARGCENYRIGGRGYRLEAGQIMIAPHEEGSDCEIRKGEGAGTLGLCTLIRGATDELEWAFGPLVLSAGCGNVGPMLRKSAEALWKGSRSKDQLAKQLIGDLRSELPNVASSVLIQAAAVEGKKPSTRFEMVRRANLAQAHLHSVDHRAVDLNELAGVVGVSPFRLLTAFQQCFGETPAAYHRKLRLRLALEQARRRKVPVSMIVDEFGFASASSFSHAYRRAFGHSPVWRKAC